jgi:hypothetical protein
LCQACKASKDDPVKQPIEQGVKTILEPEQPRALLLAADSQYLCKTLSSPHPFFEPKASQKVTGHLLHAVPPSQDAEGKPKGKLSKCFRHVLLV